MGDIYESLAVVVFLWPAFITAGAAGYMGLFFFITAHYMEQTGVSVPARCGASCGCCKYFFGLFNPVFL